MINKMLNMDDWNWREQATNHKESPTENNEAGLVKVGHQENQEAKETEEVHQT